MAARGVCGGVIWRRREMACRLHQRRRVNNLGRGETNYSVGGGNGIASEATMTGHAFRQRLSGNTHAASSMAAVSRGAITMAAANQRRFLRHQQRMAYRARRPSVCSP